MRASFRLSVLLLCGGAIGCANLSVQKLDVASNEALKGQITYYLPRTVVSVAMSLAVTKCDGIDSAPDAPAAKTPGSTELKLKVGGTATSSVQPDPAFAYRIDYRDAQTWTKEIQFTVNTTSAKVLQSFNGTINDQAGPILVAALTAAVQIAGAALIPGVGAVPKQAFEETFQFHPALAPAPPPRTCSNTVDKALNQIISDQAHITQLKAAIAAYYGKLAAGAVQPAKEDPTTAWSQAVTALSADVTTQQAKLTYNWTAVWVPASADFVTGTSVDGTPVWVATHQFPISRYLVESGLLSDDATAAYQAAPTPATAAAWTALHQPLVMKLVADPATFFSESGFVPSTDIPTDPLQAANPGGLLVRDPAAGILQNCTPIAPSPVLVQSPADRTQWVFPGVAADLAKLCPTPSLTQTGGAGKQAAEDDRKRIAVSLPQVGRPLVLTAHSALWENATLGVTLNTDGTLQSIGTHDTSTAATGLNSIASAAGAAATAETARNNAITAGNTATTTKLQLSDTVNKAVADCYTQAAAIVKAGGTPTPCQ